MRGYLGRAGIFLKDFKAYAEALADRARQHGIVLAEVEGKPVEYLRNSLERKHAPAEAASRKARSLV
jgi:hypothetical protein